jgi:hypothetical protein
MPDPCCLYFLMTLINDPRLLKQGCLSAYRKVW